MDSPSDIFLSVIESNKGIIYKVANLYCKIEEDRKDLIQEIVIQLWKSFSRYDGRFKHSTWIYRIALNVSISFYRKNRVRNEHTEDFSDLISNSLQANDPKGNDPNLGLLHQFIQELNEVDKALIILYLDGKSQKEISQVLGMSATNISTKVGRIKETLKQKFSSLKKQQHAGQ